ncbi:hypothetical protein ACFL0D_07760 [Thermoproteota archaeon]
MRKLQDYFDTKVEIPLIRHGKRQRVETLINEEALLVAKYIRNENKEWKPRQYKKVLKKKEFRGSIIE